MLVESPHGAARLGGASEPTGSCGEVEGQRRLASRTAEPEFPSGEEALPTRPAPPGPLPAAEQLPPPPLRVEWPVADILPLPFSAAATASYAAYRLRRTASTLLRTDSMVLQGYASQLEVLAEDLEHAFETPPMWGWAPVPPVWGMAL